MHQQTGTDLPHANTWQQERHNPPVSDPCRPVKLRARLPDRWAFPEAGGPTRRAQPAGVSRSRGPATAAVRGVEHVSGGVTSVSLISGGLCPQT